MTDLAAATSPASSDTPWRSLPGLDQLLVAATGPDVFMRALLDRILTIRGIVAAWIGRPNDEGVLIPEICRAPDMAVLSDEAMMINVRSGATSHAPAGRAWRSATAQMSADVAADGSLAPWRDDWSRLGLRSAVAIPLQGVSGVHRILNLYSDDGAFFRSIWTVATLTEFGLVIGTAIESRVRNLALERSQRLLDTLFAGTEVLLDTHHETAMLRGVCQRLSKAGLFTSAAIGTIDEHGVFAYRIVAGKAAAGVRRLRQPANDDGTHSLLGLTAWRRGTVQTADGYDSVSRLAPWRDIAVESGWSSAAAAPILRGGAMFAVLFVVAHEHGAFDSETSRLIGQLGRNIGRALDEIDLKAALRAEREAQSRIARHDKLTSLANRRAFEEQLPVALAHAKRHGTALGIGILDLDNFKPINDRYGHAAGDLVLRTLAMRIGATVRDVDFVARLGGDEFALIIADLHSAASLAGFCARLGDAIREPIMLDRNTELRVSASLGLTFFPLDQAEPDTLIRHADIALYASKAGKTARSRFWMTYQECIGAAPAASPYSRLLTSDHIEVHYQPVISVGSGRIYAIEALARLHDGTRLIAPGEFLPGLTAEARETLFAEVLRQGLQCLRNLAAIAPDLHLSVNLDAEVIARGNICRLIGEALAESDIAPQRLTIELLESHEFPDPDLGHECIAILRNCGVAIALDDLGIEFSTLKRVRRLPVDHLKIDKLFLAEVQQNPHDLIFLSTYITMAKSLGLNLCIEGVETCDMLDALRILGAPLAQGFGIARPMPEAELIRWMSRGITQPMRGPPRTMLGAYALHVRWVAVLLFAPHESALRHYLRRGGKLSLDMFLRRAGLDNTPLGLAYEALMDMIEQTLGDVPAIRRTADRVRALLAEAVMAQDQRSVALPPIAPDNPIPQSRQSIPDRPVRQPRARRHSRLPAPIVEPA